MPAGTSITRGSTLLDTKNVSAFFLWLRNALPFLIRSVLHPHRLAWLIFQVLLFFNAFLTVNSVAKINLLVKVFSQYFSL